MDRNQKSQLPNNRYPGTKPFDIRLLRKYTITNTIKHCAGPLRLSETPGPDNCSAVASASAVLRPLPALSHCLTYWKLAEQIKMKKIGKVFQAKREL